MKCPACGHVHDPRLELVHHLIIDAKKYVDQLPPERLAEINRSFASAAEQARRITDGDVSPLVG